MRRGGERRVGRAADLTLRAGGGGLRCCPDPRLSVRCQRPKGGALLNAKPGSPFSANLDRDGHEAQTGPCALSEEPRRMGLADTLTCHRLGLPRPGVQHRPKALGSHTPGAGSGWMLEGGGSAGVPAAARGARR